MEKSYMKPPEGDGVRKGIGEAMREALGRKTLEFRGARPQGDEDAPLLNDARRHLFFLSHDLPGAHLRLLARVAGLDQTTARWHLASLVDAGYLASERLGKYESFGPKGLLDGYAKLAVLHRPGAARLLARLAEPAPLSTLAAASGESPSNALAKLRVLESSGWVAKDGRTYSATGQLETISTAWADALPTYTGALAVRLVRQGILVQRKATRAGILMSLDLGQSKERRTIRRDAVMRLVVR